MILRDVRNNEHDLSKWPGFSEHYQDESTCAKIIIEEMNSDDIYQGIFNAHSKEDLVMIDIGANVGLFTLFMSPICKKIYSVEPTPNHLKLLSGMKDTFNLNNCVISNNAISDKTENIIFNKINTIYFVLL